MAELENEKQEEDYLDNLLNSVSGPLPEEDNNSEISDNEYDGILDLIEDDNNDISDIDNAVEDNVLDLNELSEENVLDFDKTEETPIMEKEDSDDIQGDSFNEEQEDIEQLLNMLDTESIGDELNDEEIYKIADELEDIPDLSSIEDKTDKKKKKKKGSLFGKKKKKQTKDESENLDISPDDNEQIIKSVEGSFYEGFDLSELEGLADLEDIEDRSKKEDTEEPEKTKEEIKAEKERKKKEKAEKKAEKKKLKKEKQEARKAKKAEKRKEKEKKKSEKPRIPEEKIKISISTLILIVSFIAAIVIVTIFGGKYFWYRSHINEASDLLIDKKYTEAYNSVAGLNIKEKDMGLYRQLKTLMYIEKEYNSYINCIKINMNREALDSLLQGIEKYNVYKNDAVEYGVSKQADEIYAKILNELSSTFGLTEEKANEIVNITNPQEYSKKIADIVNSHKDAIEAAKNEAKKDSDR
ncbi:MAG: hypothetical protein HDT39_13440 [Lachnospiraceae bacterium]|nr:hypothetical protein [Lachnospiraceae bacterium]